MKGKFDPYVLWPLAKKVQNWIVDWSTARDFMVFNKWIYKPQNFTYRISAETILCDLCLEYIQVQKLPYSRE